MLYFQKPLHDHINCLFQKENISLRSQDDFKKTKTLSLPNKFTISITNQDLVWSEMKETFKVSYNKLIYTCGTNLLYDSKFQKLFGKFTAIIAAYQDYCKSKLRNVGNIVIE